jgi:hypothetical protein
MHHVGFTILTYHDARQQNIVGHKTFVFFAKNEAYAALQVSAVGCYSVYFL